MGEALRTQCGEERYAYSVLSLTLLTLTLSPTPTLTRPLFVAGAMLSLTLTLTLSLTRYWKRYQSVLAFKWDCTDFEEEELLTYLLPITDY